MFRLTLISLVLCVVSEAQFLRYSPLTINGVNGGIGGHIIGNGGIRHLGVRRVVASPRVLIQPQPQVFAPPPVRVIARPQVFAQPFDESPKPFQYGYTSVDEYGTEQSRQESGDPSGVVTGSYGYRDPATGLYRIVEYVADENGFRANVRTNEPGTANANPADVNIQSEAQ